MPRNKDHAGRAGHLPPLDPEATVKQLQQAVRDDVAAATVARFSSFVTRGLNRRIHLKKTLPKMMDCRVIGERKRRRASDGYARQ